MYCLSSCSSRVNEEIKIVRYAVKKKIKTLIVNKWLSIKPRETYTLFVYNIMHINCIVYIHKQYYVYIYDCSCHNVATVMAIKKQHY